MEMVKTLHLCASPTLNISLLVKVIHITGENYVVIMAVVKTLASLS